MPSRQRPPPWEGLPIAPLIGPIQQALIQGQQLILEAAPGAGKSTTLPLALIDAPWRQGRRLLLLEPRRVAARAVATRMAAHLGEPVGQGIGWRMRDDTLVSSATHIEVITEGVLTRMLQTDPELPGVAGILFDEFHERSLQADFGLSLALDIQASLRPDLRLVVMSATLQGLDLERLLPVAEVLRSKGQGYPVELHYLKSTPIRIAEAPVIATIQTALAETSRDVLTFLPGRREIETLAEQLRARLGPDVLVAPLFGEQSAAEQSAALNPAPDGQRRVILATTIAQTSLTLEGVQAVVDSGFTRRQAYDVGSGMGRLVTCRVSRAAAEQRRGRAGRLGPGMCWRLWTSATQASLEEQDPPEILAADLLPLALDLALWGSADGSQLNWLDPPPAAALAEARALLSRLGAVTPEGGVTAHGRALLAQGLHPRLGHLLVRGAALGALEPAARLAALMSERDPLRLSREANIEDRLALLETGGRVRPGEAVDRHALDRIKRLAQRLMSRQRGLAKAPVLAAPLSTGALVSLAYPERIAQRRSQVSGTYRLTSGRGARLGGDDPLGVHEWLAIAELRDDAREALINLAAPISVAEIEALHGDACENRMRVEWSDRDGAVLCRRERVLGKLCLMTQTWEDAPEEAVSTALIEGVRSVGLTALPWSPAALSLRQRLGFIRQWDANGGWPDWDDAILLATLEEWLKPYLVGQSRLTHLARLDLHAILLDALDWPARQRLDALAPTHITVPSGSRIPLDYADPNQPCLDVRLQECFGMQESPRLAEGKVSVLFRLLSPARRPVQVTRDLRSFWAQGYAEVRKELKGRYPKHYWPEDPLKAEATARAKPRPA